MNKKHIDVDHTSLCCDCNQTYSRRMDGQTDECEKAGHISFLVHLMAFQTKQGTS